MIATACPNCGKKFKLGDGAAGKRAKCACGTVFTIPGSASPTTAAIEQRAASTPAPIVPPVVTESVVCPPQKSPAMVPEDRPAMAVVATAIRNRYAALKRMKYFRLAAISGVAILIFCGILIYKVQSYRAEARQQILRQIDENYRRQIANADQLWNKGTADIEEARRMHAQAADLRKAPASPEPAESARTTSRSEAFNSDTFIGTLTDRYPDLRPMIMKGGTALDIRLNLLVSTGNLTPAEVRYIRKFSAQLQRLPE